MAQGQIFTQSTELEIAVAALTGALQTNTDALNRMAVHGERQDEKLDHIMEALGDVKTRLTLIERTPLSSRLDKLEADIKILNDERNQRIGGIKLGEWIFRNWPGVLGFLALIATVLVATGKLTL